MKKSNKVILNIIFLLILGMSASCKKKNFENHVGPSICPTDNFQYVQQPAISQSSVNLATQSEVFTASFNEEVPWTLIIKGETSHSFKKFSGYGKAINVTWKGNPDTVVFFQAEQCTAEFKVACKESIIKTFTITVVNNFGTFGYLGFNGGDGGALGMVYGGPLYGYPQPPASPTNPLNAASTMVSNLNSPQGGNCMCTAGNSMGPNTSNAPVWYFGGFDINVSNLSTYLKPDPNEIYFNCFVNVKGSKNTVPVVVFTEGPVKRSKSLYVYGDGWQYVSFKLSEANVVNPYNISIVSFTLNSYPVQTTSGDMCLDFVSFTNDSPFISVQK